MDDAMMRQSSTVERPSRDELLAKARAIAARLRERAHETDTGRRIPSATISEFHAAGLFRLLQPARWGGREAELVDFVDVVEELARACGSSAWVYSVLTSHAQSIASLPEEGQAEIWGRDPLALAASGFAPTGTAVPVDGGYRLSGRWPFSSGCDYAQWAIIGGLVRAEDGPPIVHTFMVPIGELAIEDDWHVLGLAGTGSKCLHGADVFVPAHRAVRFAEALEGRSPGAELNDGPLYRCPRNSCAPYALATVPVGIAQGAIDHFVDYVVNKPMRGLRPMREADTIQLKIAESAAEVDAARRIVRGNSIENLETVRRTGTLPMETRARNRRDHAFTMKLCVQAVDRLYTAAGAHSLFDGNPLQRSFRDIHAAAAQIALNWEAAARAFGRIRLGLDSGDPFL
jgi:3-hydroxy-9,10-secoandrosta-1,3,5(10)-triene-9,17-dione monooxygenase